MPRRSSFLNTTPAARTIYAEIAGHRLRGFFGGKGGVGPTFGGVATMARLTRMVDRDDWCLADALGNRRARLLDVPKPEDLLERTIAEAGEASCNGLLPLAWEESKGYDIRVYDRTHRVRATGQN